MNFIFLDVDGVLNSKPYFESQKGKSGFTEISDFHLQMLSKIYHECDAKIVLTSTWKDISDTRDALSNKMYQYLVDSLKKYNMEIFSKTCDIECNRPLEIRQWLSDYIIDLEDGHKLQNDPYNSRVAYRWLNNKFVLPDIINIVILDDDFSKEKYNEYGLGDYLVKTEFYSDKIEDGGLQQKHVDLAIKILKG